MKLFAIVALSILAIANGAILETFNCDEAGDPDVSLYYSIKEEMNFKRSACSVRLFNGPECNDYFALAQKLIVEEFKLQCYYSQFWLDFEGSLVSNEDDVLDALDSIVDAMLEDPDNQVLNFRESVQLKIEQVQMAFVEIDPLNPTTGSFEGRLLLLLNDETRYTDDVELQEFKDAIETTREDALTALAEDISTTLSDGLQSVLDRVVLSGAALTLEDRLGAIIAEAQNAFEVRSSGHLEQINQAYKDLRKRWLEHILMTGYNGIRKRATVWSLILPESPGFVSYTSELAELVAEAKELAKANHGYCENKDSDDDNDKKRSDNDDGNDDSDSTLLQQYRALRQRYICALGEDSDDDTYDDDNDDGSKGNNGNNGNKGDDN